MIRLLLLWLLLWPACPIRAECTGPFKDLTPTAAQWRDLLANHKAWAEARPKGTSWKEYLKNSGADPGRANLCQANLVYGKLRTANLSMADLGGASLFSADLIGANLSMADLSDADLTYTNLSGADLSMAHLNGAQAVWAKLDGADLKEANLSGAYLSGADLTKASLDGTNLSGAWLGGADLGQALFIPQTGKLPDIAAFAYARNLDRMRTTPESLPVLAEFREAFKKAGFREAERAMTYLVKRQQEAFEAPEERWFSRIFFDWTSAYGLHPGWSLLIMAGLAILLSFVYLAALVRTGGGGDLGRVVEGPAEPGRGPGRAGAAELRPALSALRSTARPAPRSSRRPPPAAEAGPAKPRGPAPALGHPDLASLGHRPLLQRPVRLPFRLARPQCGQLDRPRSAPRIRPPPHRLGSGGLGRAIPHQRLPGGAVGADLFRTAVRVGGWFRWLRLHSANRTEPEMPAG